MLLAVRRFQWKPRDLLRDKRFFRFAQNRMEIKNLQQRSFLFLHKVDICLTISKVLC